MRGGTTFADVLEHTLGALQPDTPLSGTSPGYRPAPPPFLLFGPRRFHFQSTPYAALRNQPRAARPDRPSRTLTPGQRRALDGLIRLGANLQTDFTTRELRTAFRRLARRYHPDGHPGGSDAEKARLARAFSEVEGYYRLLRDAQPA